MRDPSTAREGLAEATRRAEAAVRGSSPTFGLYLSCSGRGRALFGEPDVDIRILQKRFPRIPIAGDFPPSLCANRANLPGFPGGHFGKHDRR